MTFSLLLEQYKPGILDKWLNLVLDTYPPETAQLLKDEKDRFANPVAYNIKNSLEKILHYLINGLDRKDAMDNLEQIIKIRAVQDFSPAQAISFTWLLKESVLGELKNRTINEDIRKEWLEFDLKVDELTGQAFNLYMACKEKIYELRIKELKAEKSVLTEMLNSNGVRSNDIQY